jgi:DNA repair exonuclease SbcCD nuclease subunit
MQTNFIATSDWHIRLDRPKARIDDFVLAQTTKVKFILSLARKHNCPVLIGGDLGNKPQWGDKLLNYFIDILNDFPDVEIITVCGQHDLPQHRLNKWKESGLGVLHKRKCIKVLTAKYKNIQPFSYSKELFDSGAEISLVHTMVIENQINKLWQKQVAPSAKRIMDKLKNTKYIITGDNHQSFVVKNEKQTLINCGSIMRMSANQVNFKPSVYLFNTESDTIQRVYLPIEKDVFDTSHLTENKERDTRIESFVDRLSNDYEIGMERTEEKVWMSLDLERDEVLQYEPSN